MRNWNHGRHRCCAKSPQSCPTLCNPMDGTPQIPLSIGFSRQENWSEVPFCSPEDFTNPGTEPTSVMPPAPAGRFFTTSTNWITAQNTIYTEENRIKYYDFSLSPQYSLLPTPPKGGSRWKTANIGT